MKTAVDRSNIMDAILNSDVINTLINLKGRWADEKEYEDFNEYKALIEKTILAAAPKGTKVLKISKAFTILLEVPEFPYKPEIYLNTNLGWRSTKK